MTGKIGEFHAHVLDSIGSLYYTEESFDDFLQFVSTQPRYARALNSGAEGFYSALQSAGYATDPGYAEKIRNIAGRIEQILLTDS